MQALDFRYRVIAEQALISYRKSMTYERPDFAAGYIQTKRKAPFRGAVSSYAMNPYIFANSHSAITTAE